MSPLFPQDRAYICALCPHRSVSAPTLPPSSPAHGVAYLRHVCIGAWMYWLLPAMSQGATFVVRSRMGRPATPRLASCLQNKQSGEWHVGTRMQRRRAFQDNQESFQRQAKPVCRPEVMTMNPGIRLGREGGVCLLCWPGGRRHDGTYYALSPTLTVSVQKRDPLANEETEAQNTGVRGSRGTQPARGGLEPRSAWHQYYPHTAASRGKT